MFSALRQGSPFYILEKGEAPVLKIGQIESVSQPKPKYNTYNPALNFGMNMETVVDVTVMIDGNKKEYLGIPSNLSTHGYGNVVVSESKEAMVQEIDGMLQTSKQIVDSVDYHKALISSYENILKQLNPSFAKEQERDDAIESLTAQVNSMKGEMSKILELLTKAAN